MKKDEFAAVAKELEEKEGIIPVLLVQDVDNVSQLNLTESQVKLLYWLEDNHFLTSDFNWSKISEIPIDYDVREDN